MYKEYFEDKKPIAYYSGLNGLEIYGIEYGSYVYYTTGAWNGKTKYHRSKLYYCKSIKNADKVYFICRGYRIHLNECIRMDI